MAVTQSDIDALEAAINSGAQRVRYRDHEVTYRDQSQMERRLAAMKRELAGQGRRRPRTFVATGSKGL